MATQRETLGRRRTETTAEERSALHAVMAGASVYGVIATFAKQDAAIATEPKSPASKSFSTPPTSEAV